MITSDLGFIVFKYLDVKWEDRNPNLNESYTSNLKIKDGAKITLKSKTKVIYEVQGNPFEYKLINIK